MLLFILSICILTTEIVLIHRSRQEERENIGKGRLRGRCVVEVERVARKQRGRVEGAGSGTRGRQSRIEELRWFCLKENKMYYYNRGGRVERWRRGDRVEGKQKVTVRQPCACSIGALTTAGGTDRSVGARYCPKGQCSAWGKPKHRRARIPSVGVLSA